MKRKTIQKHQLMQRFGGAKFIRLLPKEDRALVGAVIAEQTGETNAKRACAKKAFETLARKAHEFGIINFSHIFSTALDTAKRFGLDEVHQVAAEDFIAFRFRKCRGERELQLVMADAQELGIPAERIDKLKKESLYHSYTYLDIYYEGHYSEARAETRQVQRPSEELVDPYSFVKIIENPNTPEDKLAEATVNYLDSILPWISRSGRSYDEAVRNDVSYYLVGLHLYLCTLARHSPRGSNTSLFVESVSGFVRKTIEAGESNPRIRWDHDLFEKITRFAENYELPVEVQRDLAVELTRTSLYMWALYDHCLPWKEIDERTMGGQMTLGEAVQYLLEENERKYGIGKSETCSIAREVISHLLDESMIDAAALDEEYLLERAIVDKESYVYAMRRHGIHAACLAREFGLLEEFKEEFESLLRILKSEGKTQTALYTAHNAGMDREYVIEEGTRYFHELLVTDRIGYAVQFVVDLDLDPSLIPIARRAYAEQEIGKGYYCWLVDKPIDPDVTATLSADEIMALRELMALKSSIEDFSKKRKSDPVDWTVAWHGP